MKLDGRFLVDAAMREMNVTRLNRQIFLGIDLGQREYHSAFVVLERFEVMPSYTDVLRGKDIYCRYVVRQAERVGLGTPYAEVVGRVKRIVDALGDGCIVVVDETGVGVPVVESMRRVVRGCAILPITITTGARSTGSSVPRAELVTRLQMMVQAGELEIAHGCRHGEELQRELVHLQLQGKHGEEPDDLAMALALACWKAWVR